MCAGRSPDYTLTLPAVFIGPPPACRPCRLPCARPRTSCVQHKLAHVTRHGRRARARLNHLYYTLQKVCNRAYSTIAAVAKFILLHNRARPVHPPPMVEVDLLSKRQKRGVSYISSVWVCELCAYLLVQVLPYLSK
jgi:hypothetical protein